MPSIALFLTVTFTVCAAVATEPPSIEQLEAKPELLQELYQPAHSLTVEEYYFRGYLAPEEPQAEIVPERYNTEDLYVVRKGSQALYVKKDAFRHPDLTFLPVNAGAAVLCLPNPSGGNAWRANPWFVVLQEPLKLLGQVSGVSDVDEDGIIDLVVADDIWEDGWPQLSHAGAPGATVFCCVKDGALVLDRQKTDSWAWRELSRLNAKILEMLPKAAAAMARRESADADLFSAILSKFLYYRALDLIDSGWEELKKDLRIFDPVQFPAGRHVPGTGAVPTTPIADIEQQAANSLETRGPLDQDLKTYFLAPLRR